ncbi:unnamed protein product, partial [Urochloa humidicola]
TAAMRLQVAARGFLARKEAQALRMARRQLSAAARIQTVLRGLLTRRKAQALHTAAALLRRNLMAAARGLLARRRALALPTVAALRRRRQATSQPATARTPALVAVAVFPAPGYSQLALPCSGGSVDRGLPCGAMDWGCRSAQPAQRRRIPTPAAARTTSQVAVPAGWGRTAGGPSPGRGSASGLSIPAAVPHLRLSVVRLHAVGGVNLGGNHEVHAI